MLNRQHTRVIYVSALLLMVCLPINALGGENRSASSAAQKAESAGSKATWKHRTVKASSYTLAPNETRSKGDQIGAFGDKLSPGKRVVAVSHDLIKAGLTEGTRVRIKGLKGTYTVLDKMNRRWKNKIDILFAKRKSALEWGVKTVEIRYLPSRHK